MNKSNSYFTPKKLQPLLKKALAGLNNCIAAEELAINELTETVERGRDIACKTFSVLEARALLGEITEDTYDEIRELYPLPDNWEISELLWLPEMRDSLYQLLFSRSKKEIESSIRIGANKSFLLHKVADMSALSDLHKDRDTLSDLLKSSQMGQDSIEVTESTLLMMDGYINPKSEG